MFHSGDPLTVVEVSAGQDGGDATVKETLLGSGAGESLIHTVKAGTTFGAFCGEGPAGFSLVTCVVAPGFDYRDWTMLGAAALTEKFTGARAAWAIGKLAHRTA